MACDDAHLIETLRSREQLLKGRFLDVRRDLVGLPDGGEGSREYVVHPGAVMVVPMLDDGRLVIERQYRWPLQQVLLEFPAGKKDPGESGRVCGQRELLEETGYRATDWGYAGVLHNAAAYSTEHIEIWFARGLTAGPSALDAGEHLEVLAMAEDEIDRLAGQGVLTDAKTLIGLLWLQKWRAGRWPVRWSSDPV